MIIDHIKNASLYFGLHQRLAAGLCYLQSTNLDGFKPGRYELDGSNLFILISEYETKPKEAGRWEAHRRYFDIQYLIKGEECIGFSSLEFCRRGSYDEDKDFQEIVLAEGELMTLRPGMFMILGPQDAHMPGLVSARPQPVKKAVVKALV
jgi:YhcH/YjgK/YiaL family protein